MPDLSNPKSETQSPVPDFRAFARVVLPLPLEQPFTYAVPNSLRHRATVGMRAVVPFQKRVETGTIVELDATSDVANIRPLIDLPDDTPIFSGELLELCKWIAEYYCCSWGEALQSAVPAGITIRTKMKYTLDLAQIAAGRFTDKQRKIIATLHSRGTLTEKQLAKTVGSTALSNTLKSLVARGIVRAEPLAADASVSIATETCVRIVETAIPLQAELERMQRRAPRQAAVYLDLLNNEPERVASALYEQHGIDSAVLRQLEQRGLVERFEREFYRMPDLHADGRAAQKHVLNGDQAAAFHAISTAMESSQFQAFLLQGITGSGKTEVYLQAIERALALDRTAIILVPEISLTPQTVGRFKARFQADIAVLHSGLGAGERYDEWRRAQRGEVRIVVGARSAIFAPLPRLGIIVVDEEHDTSYKQGETPRYHARDVAIMRAKLNGAVCVLGSATPSIESYYNSESGKSVRIELRKRATNALLPEVEVVDMRTENREAGMQLMISRRLEEAIGARLSAGDQVLLLLNRRGFAPFVLCPKCGWCAQCPDCCVTMTYHAKGAFLSCHYCNTRRDVPQVCDECHFNPLLYLGMGTQKIEDYLQKSFPDARIARMDADTTSGKGGHAKILGRLAAGEIDVLVGTQMIAKGHDYPGVTLVGVIHADTGLGLPDFRAAETTFQLLTQVAGRAGRGDKPGRVIIQTFRPNHYAVQAAAHHDYAAFFAREIKERERAKYPPFRRMANIMIECEDPELAEHCAGILHRLAREHIVSLGFEGLETLGPSPATIRRVKKLYRWNLGLLSRSPKRLNTLCRAVRDAYTQNSITAKTKLKIDLDPYGMY
ncbi:MAG: primosomal protein N' [Candidatus Hydrogenedentes bacterium]|nr:primosomal protein N' [Candidatus Hydrogenedentota bacterium]